MNLELAGKSVVVTGGGSCIGRAIVLTYAEEGDSITIGDIGEAQAGKVADLARERGAVRVVGTDITQHDQGKALMDQADARHGGINVLLNNVGWERPMFFTQTTPELWDKIIRVNYLSVFNCTSAALEKMIPAERDSIVSISADASRQGEPREAVYGGTRAAVNRFMKTNAPRSAPRQSRRSRS